MAWEYSMEAFLLTLDVVAIIILALAVIKVKKSNDPKKMGVFSYLDVRRKSKRSLPYTGA